MNKVPSSLVRFAAAVVALSVAGCATYYQPRYGDDGVYYDDRYARASAHTVYAANPVYYPYWSLDYFYFSRHYHPYSFFVGYYDPFYYPYPGWYYGYRPGPRVSLAFSYGFYYPWFGFGPHYHFYRPWWFAGHHVHHHRQPVHPVRRVDARLREMQRREVAAARTQPTLTGAARAQQLGYRGAVDGRTTGQRATSTQSTRQQRQQSAPATSATRASSRTQRSQGQARPTSDRPTISGAARRSGDRTGRRPDRPRGIDMNSFQRSGFQAGADTGSSPAVRSSGDFTQTRSVIPSRPAARPAIQSRPDPAAGAPIARTQRGGPPAVLAAPRRPTAPVQPVAPARPAPAVRPQGRETAPPVRRGGRQSRSLPPPASSSHGQATRKSSASGQRANSRRDRGGGRDRRRD